jgi:hypothetical protein
VAGVTARLPHVLHEVGFTGTSTSIPLNVALGPGSGVMHVNGAGAACTLPIVAKAASGRMVIQGSGRAVSLASLSAGKAAGKASVYVFTGPFELVHDYMAAPLSRRFVCSTQVGLTTWRDGTGWHTEFRPDAARLLGADVVLAGGRVHPLPSELRGDLIAAGLDTYITLQEVRQ